MLSSPFFPYFLWSNGILYIEMTVGGPQTSPSNFAHTIMSILGRHDVKFGVEGVGDFVQNPLYTIRHIAITNHRKLEAKIRRHQVRDLEIFTGPLAPDHI